MYMYMYIFICIHHQKQNKKTRHSPGTKIYKGYLGLTT